VYPLRYELNFYIPEDDILHSHRRENLKFYIALTGRVLFRRRNVSPVKYELHFYISEDDILHSHRRKNYKFATITSFKLFSNPSGILLLELIEGNSIENFVRQLTKMKFTKILTLHVDIYKLQFQLVH
jgi:hypothetical protein